MKKYMAVLKADRYFKSCNIKKRGGSKYISIKTACFRKTDEIVVSLLI